jgi:hypothetical protein
MALAAVNDMKFLLGLDRWHARRSESDRAGVETRKYRADDFILSKAIAAHHCHTA